MMTKIKICGIRTIADADCLNRCRPDYTGFVFWPHSHRYLELATAAKLRERLEDGISTVGVYVDEDIARIAEAAEQQIINVVQLHGHEDNDYIRRVKDRTGLPVIKAVRIAGSRADYAGFPAADYLLFDSGMGSGRAFDWQRLKVRTDKPFFIAGGISTKNVAAVMDIFAPFGVDLSSSVEMDGQKDPEKIRRVVEAVREKGKANE